MSSARLISLIVIGVLFGVYLESPLRAELRQPSSITSEQVGSGPAEWTLFAGTANNGNQQHPATSFESLAGLSLCGCDSSAMDCGCGTDCGAGVAPTSCLTRSHLLGDWLGVRPGLAEHGILVDLYQTNYYQGVASGGVEQTFKYGGKLDCEVTFEGAKLGLNKGFFAFMHAESRYGDAVNLDAGALAFPNTAMIWPLPKHVTSISGLYAIQT
ncbi:MAG: hypothetical protein WBB95_29005, partial [Pseudomonas sp.]|uniref:hypothetical protein n=1 Tax=Pseudomonas sp. TaxID=306 RepID=UPI003C7743D7